MALALQGAAGMRCNVFTDGRGGARISFAAVFREQWPDPVDYGERDVMFTPLPRKVPLVVTADNKPVERPKALRNADGK